jgi:hypothetical protein
MVNSDPKMALRHQAWAAALRRLAFYLPSETK